MVSHRRSFELVAAGWATAGWGRGWFCGTDERANDFSVHFWFLATVHCDLGEWNKAQEYAEEAVRLAHRNDEMYVEGISKIVLGRILTLSGNWQGTGAEESILQGIRILSRLKITTLSALGHLCLAELYLISNRRIRALKPFYISQRIFRKTGMEYWLKRTQDSLKEPLRS